MILVDTGPLYSMIDTRDPHHGRCLRTLALVRPPLVTTDAVIAEAMHLLGKHLGWAGQAALWGMVRDGGLLVAAVPPELRLPMAQWMERYRDLPMDYADASLLAIAESQGIDTIFSIDSDFHVYRMRNGKTLRVVP